MIRLIPNTDLGQNSINGCSVVFKLEDTVLSIYIDQTH